MADSVIGIDVVARIDNLRAELAKIPDIGAGEAKALTAQLAKEIKGAERAAKDAAKASRDAAKANAELGKRARETADSVNHAAQQMEHFGDASGKAGSNAGKLSGALDLVAPGAGGAAMAVQALADVAEVGAAAAGALGLSLGALASIALPLAAIVAGVGLAWQSYSEIAQDATEYQERLNAALDGVDPIAKRARDEIDKLKLNIGQLTQAQFDDNEIRKDFADALDTGTEKLREERDAISDQMATIGKANATYLKLQDRLHEVNGLIETATTLNEQGTEAALANAEIGRERSESEKVLADRLKAKAEAERKAAEAARKAAEASREVTEATKAYNDILHAEEAAGAKARASYDAAISKLGDLTAADEAAGLAKSERMAVDHEAALQQIADLEAQALAAAQTATGVENAEAASLEARRAENARYYAEVETLHDALQAKLIDDADKVAKKQAEVNAKVAAASVAAATSTLNALDSIATTIQANAEAAGKDQEKLALAAFAVHQGAAIASAGITTAQAALAAYAAALELGAPGLVLAPIAAGAAVATGLAQVAAIASEPPPKFHAGLAPDEYQATLKRGEGVLSGQGMRSAGGPEAVRAMNAGKSPGGAQTIVIKHNGRYFDAAVSENIKSGGSLAQLRAGRVGHRRRR